MNPRNTRQLRALIERRQAAYLWGKKSMIVPRLVTNVWGDGRKLIGIHPIMYRPNYFVLRIDSAWETDSDEFRDHLDDFYDEIELDYPEWPWAKAYGLRWTDDETADRSSRTNMGEGSCWFEMQWPRLKRKAVPL